jgi:two-component system NtrC family sensor kinase
VEPGQPQRGGARAAATSGTPRTDTLREIGVVREAGERLPTSLRLSTVLGVFMVATLLLAAVSFYLVARFFGQRLGDELLVSAAVACLFALLAGLSFVRFYFGPVLGFAETIMRKLQHLTDTLEHRVTERTAALVDTNAKLRGSLDENRGMQQQIVDASRRAGMADVATSVIHNVGNVLNSVNVSAGLVRETVERSRAQGLGQLTALIRQHENDWVQFLTQDEKGRRLPAYLEAVAAAVEEERRIIVAELASLQRNIDHIKVVVGRQQGQAKAALGVLESVVLATVVDEALRVAGLDQDSVAKSNDDGILVERLYGEVPRARLDRHKLMETLTNLIGNAHHALQAVPRSIEHPRRLRIAIRSRDNLRFEIEISDSGCGISPENLPRIFTFGFTTKPGGHGFGLHASAIATAEMGGTLTAHSDGPGCGARFRIELPLRPPASGAARADDFGPLATPPPEVLSPR